MPLRAIEANQMTIVLATDGSAHAKLAEDLMAKLFRGSAAAVDVACVVAHPHVPIVGIQPYGAAFLSEEVGRIVLAARDAAQGTVDSCAERLRAAGFSANAVVLEGDPGTELLDFAERAEADLIVVGSRGHGAIQSWILGSVARKLAAHARCSVLVGRSPRDVSPQDVSATIQARAKLSIVVCVDGTPGAQAAIDWVKGFGPGTFERVVALCAEPLSVVPAGVDPMAFGSFYQYDHERVEAIAQAAAAELEGIGDSTAAVTELGRPAAAIQDVAVRDKADLIVLGATRHGTIERFLIGSVSYEVASSAPCSVAIVRPASSNA
jgi:nucleotide-binding universal stress UspA family protein